jgi:CBS domain-containing protein
MWWPLLGGLAVGIGGYFEPRALGVGYNIIEQLMQGEYTFRSLMPLLVVKAAIWSIALGSGTSGGVLAPLLMMGGILGGLEASFLPGGDPRIWPLISMAAVMGGAMRAPLTGVLFAVELTYDVRLLLPLLIASAISYAFTVLVLKRSILTEKIARRGYNISCEYGVDPMDRQSVGEVMTADVVAIPATLPVEDLLKQFFLAGGGRKHQGYPVVDQTGQVVGVITKSDLLEDWLHAWAAGKQRDSVVRHPIISYDLIGRSPVTAYPWEPCRAAAERMARLRVGRLPVISPDEPHVLVGIITRSDLLKSHALRADEEETRQRFFANYIPGVRRPAVTPAEQQAS